MYGEEEVEEEEEEQEDRWSASGQPNTRAQLNMHSIVRRRVDLRCCTPTRYLAIVILFGSRQNLRLCFVSCACLGITWPSGRVSRQRTGPGPLWQADGLAAGCCPLEGAAPSYSVREGVFIMRKEEEQEKRKK